MIMEAGKSSSLKSDFANWISKKADGIVPVRSLADSRPIKTSCTAKD
jgi:hypothetical protein